MKDLPTESHLLLFYKRREWISVYLTAMIRFSREAVHDVHDMEGKNSRFREIFGFFKSRTFSRLQYYTKRAIILLSGAEEKQWGLNTDRWLTSRV